MTDFFARHDITDQIDAPDSKEPTQQNDPTANNDPKLPIDPIDTAEPTEPIERNEFFDAIERNEFSDAIDQRDVELFVPTAFGGESIAGNSACFGLDGKTTRGWHQFDWHL